jgi:general secretion pathway protein L
MKPIPSLRLRDLGYAPDGTLRFQAAAPTADDINRLLLALQQEGWQVTVPPQLAPDASGATVAAITVRAP